MKPSFLLLPISGIAIALSACQSNANPPIPIVDVKDLPTPAASASTPLPKVGSSISYKQAVALALNNSPKLKPFSHRLRAADGLILQASLRPNPTLDAQIESVLGSGNYRGFDAAESTVAISQLLERGGKRQARREVQVAGKALILSDYEIMRRQVFAEVAQSYAQALAAQERVQIYDKLLKLNESFLPDIEKRIKAGKVTTVERTRAKTAITAAKLLKIQAERAFRVARVNLAATWGSASPKFQSVTGKLGKLPSPKSQASLQQRLFSHPAYLRGSKKIAQSYANYHLANANGVQDITIQGGVRHYWEGDDDVAFLVGISIPLPFHNRNQGKIAATKEQIKAATKEREATLVDLKTRLATSFETLTSIRNEINAIQKELLPGAQEAYDGVKEGYQKGRFTYLDLIDAQRSLADAQVQLLQSKAAYQQAAAEIAALTAPLPGQRSTK